MIKELIKIRIKKGLSQRKLAKLSGLTQPNVCRIEKGGNITLSNLMKLAEALNVEFKIHEKDKKG